MRYSVHRSHLLILGLLGVLCIVLLCALVVILVVPRNTPQQGSVSQQVVNTNTVSTPVSSESESTQTPVNTNLVPTRGVFTGTTFSLFAPDFVEGTTLPQRFTCDGVGTFPELEVYRVPQEAVSLAFVMHDPNIPDIIRADHTWYHAVAWNIPVTASAITLDLIAPTVYGATTSGSSTYVPPCPPDAEHHYVFTLYALDTTLDLAAGSTASQLLEAVKGRIVDTSVLTAVYNRHE